MSQLQLQLVHSVWSSLNHLTAINYAYMSQLELQLPHSVRSSLNPHRQNLT